MCQAGGGIEDPGGRTGTYGCPMPEERPIRLVVLFGGQSAEHDVSCVTAAHVLRAADPERYAIEALGITRDGQWVTAEDARAALAGGAAALPASLSAVGPAIDPTAAVVPAAGSDETVVVFPLLHGPMGEDGTVQGLLELAGVPYVGSGVLGSALAMDKVVAKQITDKAGIPQARWRAWRSHQITTTTVDDAIAELGLPLFVKPANMGSSIGVSKAHDRAEAREALELALSYDDWVLVEEAVAPAREIELAVLGNESPRVSVPGEVKPAAEFYDYDDKYHDGAAELLIPAPLDDELTARFQDLAVQAYTALRADGMARVDFFYEEHGRGPLLNEINTIPGFTPISMYPKLWEASGLSYPDLIDELVRLALERHEGKAKIRRTDRGLREG
jgi:D-alanine-D-alanine ligase